MKPGFLNDPKASKNGLGPLRDPRSGAASWQVPALPSNRGLGSASKDWKIELGWGKDRRVERTDVAASSVPRDVVMNDCHADDSNNNDNNNDDAISVATRATTKTFASVSTISTMHSSSTSAPSPPTTPQSLASNPFAGQPWLPSKTLGVPKAALNAWYMQKPRNHQCSKDQYISWNDGGMPHQLNFTSVFVCPLSGELFFSGEYGDSKHYTVKEEQGAKVVWYAKKTLAEHGAAARAYDCHSHRQHFGTTMRSVHLGWEAPYLTHDLALELHQPAPPPHPRSMPPHVERLVREQVRIATHRMQVEAIVADAHRQSQDERFLSDRDAQLERDAYRHARGRAFDPSRAV